MQRASNNPDQWSDPCRKRTMDAVIVYAYGTEDAATVKIGRADSYDHLLRRRRQHEGHGLNRRPLRFLAGVWGSPKDETAVQRYFKDDLIENETEWFHATEAVISWVRWLRRNWYVARTEKAVNEVPRESSELWLPSAERHHHHHPAQLLLDVWDSLEVPITQDDFYTHPLVLDAARDCMGGIDLDPASHPIANKEVRAGRYYTVVDDGLQQPWGGRVWCNPPFGKWGAWAPKILHEWRSGRISQMCLLVAGRSITAKQLHPVVRASAAVVIPNGRIPFGGLGGSPDDGHLVVYFGYEIDSFRRAFQPVGHVYITPTEPS